MRLLFLPLALLVACGGNAPAASGAQSHTGTTGTTGDCEERTWRGDGERVCEERTFTLDTRALRVDATPNGGITVDAWDRNEIEVVARIDASAPTAPEVEALLAQVRIETGETVRARIPESRDNRWVSVSYTIRAPRDADLDVRTVNGGITVRDVEGRLRATAVNGGLDLDGVGGDVTAKTTNGGVSLRLARGLSRGDALDVETTNGGIELAASGDLSAEIDLSTGNGPLRIDDFDLGEVDCERSRWRSGCVGG
ncbi:MAG: hypothetical protein AAFQ43_09265, partial [Bacteroidota bacterium]